VELPDDFDTVGDMVVDYYKLRADHASLRIAYMRLFARMMEGVDCYQQMSDELANMRKQLHGRFK
jgi:hypothetical protein